VQKSRRQASRNPAKGGYSGNEIPEPLKPEDDGETFLRWIGFRLDFFFRRRTVRFLGRL
jgi:hypothetical protein